MIKDEDEIKGILTAGDTIGVHEKIQELDHPSLLLFRNDTTYADYWAAERSFLQSSLQKLQDSLNEAALKEKKSKRRR